MKRGLFFLLVFSAMFISPGLSNGNELRVISERADIYAEPDSNSYLIETVVKGTSLHLFQKGKIRKNWYYIVFFSEQRKGKVSGFIQDSMVVDASDFKEDKDQAVSVPSVREVYELKQKEKATEKQIDEELSTTPLERRESKISASPTLEFAAFKEISEGPVEIEKRPGLSDLSFSKIEGKVFKKISEPSIPFQRKKKSTPFIREEELTITPLLLEGDGNVLLEQVAPTREEAAFLRMIESPVELDVREIPDVSASPTKEVSTFQRHQSRSDPIEEQIATPLLMKSDNSDELHSMASSVMEAVAFRSMIEPLVKLTVKSMPAMTDFPAKEVVAFRKTLEPPVELKVSKTPDLTDFPVKEIRVYEALEETISEELSTTPLLEKNPIGTLSNIEEKGDGNSGGYLPSIAFSMKDAVAFRIVIEPLVEIESKTASLIYPFPEMESLAFQRIKKASPKMKGETSPIIQQAETKTAEVSVKMKDKIQKMEEPQKKIEVKPILVQTKRESDKFRRITLGLGYGQSLGGVGGFLQFNLKAGISIHGGVGYYPSTYIYAPHDWVKNVILFNGGIKYYLPLKADPIHVYLDVQYGGIGVEAAQIIKGIWRYTFVFEYKQKTLWGPSFLTGIEFRVGHVGLNGALGLSYNLTKLDWSIQNYFLTFDIGLLLLF